MTTFAQKLWRDDVKTGRCSEREALQTFCVAVKEEDINRQVNSMPDEMFAALNMFLQPIADADGKLEWSKDALQLSTSVLHAFDSDLEKASQWKRHRLEIIYVALQKRMKNPKAV